MAFQFDPSGARPVDDTPKNFSFDPSGATLEKDEGGLASDLAKSVKVGVQRLPGMAAGLALRHHADMKKALGRGLVGGGSVAK